MHCVLEKGRCISLDFALTSLKPVNPAYLQLQSISALLCLVKATILIAHAQDNRCRRCGYVGLGIKNAQNLLSVTL